MAEGISKERQNGDQERLKTLYTKPGRILNVGGVYQKRRANLPQKPSFRNQKPRTSDVSGAETPHSKVSDAETPQSKVKESKGEYSRAEESIVNTAFLRVLVLIH